MRLRKAILSLTFAMSLLPSSGCTDATVEGARQGVVNAYTTVVQGLIVSFYALAVNQIVVEHIAQEPAP